MSGKTWVLKGIDPAQRQIVREAAAREGLSVAEYLSRTLQRSVDASEDEEAPEPAADADRPSTLRRIDNMERRISQALASLDGALRSVDHSVFKIADRLEDTETLSQNTAQAVAGAFAEFSQGLEAVRAETDQIAAETLRLRRAHEIAQTENHETSAILHDEIERACAIAAGAETAAADVKAAQDALSARLRGQIAELAVAAEESIEDGLAAARAAAEAAAQSAEDALAEALENMRRERDAIARRFSDVEHAAAKFAESAAASAEAHAAALAARIGETDQRLDGATKELGRAGAAIDALKGAQADLAAKLARGEEASRAARDTMRREWEAGLVALRQDQAAGAGQLKGIDKALADTAAIINGPIAQRFAQLESALAARASDAADLNAARAHDTAELNAALSQLDAKLQELAERPVSKLDPAILARFDDLAQRLRATEAQGDAAFAKNHDLEQCLELLGQHIAENAVQSHDALASLEQTVAEFASHASDAAAKSDVDAIAQKLEQRLEQRFEQRLEERLEQRLRALEDATAAKLESERAALAGFMQETRAALAANGLNEAVGAIDQRLGGLESTQAQMTETLSNELTRMSAMMDQRLQSVEQFCDTAPVGISREEVSQLVASFDSRLNDFENRDSAATQNIGEEVELMRQRFDERFAQIERRSVQAIERISESVAALTHRVNKPQDDEYVLDLVEQVDPADPRLAHNLTQKR